MPNYAGRKIDAMHARFGVGVGICANCPHLITHVWDKTYYNMYLARKQKKQVQDASDMGKAHPTTSQ